MNLINLGLGRGRKVDSEDARNSGQIQQVNKNDDTETNSERLTPGHENIERFRWLLEQSNAGLIVPALAAIGRGIYLLSPLPHLHLLVWVALAVYIVWEATERLNALPFALTWSLVSGFLGLVGIGFGLAVLLGWV